MLSLFKKKGNKPIEVTEKNFNEVIFNSEKPVLLDFYADWCQPCQVMTSLMTRLAKNEDFKDQLIIGKINIDFNPQLSSHFKVRSVPTLLYIQNNKILERSPGLIPYGIIEEKVYTHFPDLKKD